MYIMANEVSVLNPSELSVPAIYKWSHAREPLYSKGAARKVQSSRVWCSRRVHKIVYLAV